MTESFIELTGTKNRTTSIVIVGTHGNERCGIEAIERLIPTLTVTKGRVLFAHGNPKAIEQDVRFTEANLNRMFKSDDLLSEKEKSSYEYTRSQVLKGYMDQADALLDVHASNTPDSKPFIICDKRLNPIAKYLPFDLVVNGFNEIQPGGTESYMDAKGSFGICIECGYVNDKDSTNIAERAILAFLAERGHIDQEKVTYPQSVIEVDELYLTKTNGFKIERQFDDFEKMTKGQLIGIDGDESVFARKDGVIIFARSRNGIGEEGFVFGEYKKGLA